MEFDTPLKGAMFCKPLRIGAFIGVHIFNKYFVNVILFALKPNVAIFLKFHRISHSSTQLGH